MLRSMLTSRSVCLFRKPYHPKLEAFVSHMSKGSGASFESPLHSLPLFPNHPLCEMGELTQTGTCDNRLHTLGVNSKYSGARRCGLIGQIRTGTQQL